MFPQSFSKKSKLYRNRREAKFVDFSKDCFKLRGNESSSLVKADAFAYIVSAGELFSKCDNVPQQTRKMTSFSR